MQLSPLDHSLKGSLFLHWFWIWFCHTSTLPYLTLPDRSFVCFVRFFKAKHAGKQNWWFENWWDSETVQCTLFKCAIIGIWQFAIERRMMFGCVIWDRVQTTNSGLHFPPVFVHVCCFSSLARKSSLLIPFYNVFHFLFLDILLDSLLYQEVLCGEEEKGRFFPFVIDAVGASRPTLLNCWGKL